MSNKEIVTWGHRSGKTEALKRRLREEANSLEDGETLNIAFLNSGHTEHVSITKNINKVKTQTNGDNA